MQQGTIIRDMPTLITEEDTTGRHIVIIMRLNAADTVGTMEGEVVEDMPIVITLLIRVITAEVPLAEVVMVADIQALVEVECIHPVGLVGVVVLEEAVAMEVVEAEEDKSIDVVYISAV